jgi:hypothetical protein
MFTKSGPAVINAAPAASHLAVVFLFLIGISSDRGSTWTFIDGTQATKEELAQLVPDFPAQLSLPTPPEHPVVEVK